MARVRFWMGRFGWFLLTVAALVLGLYSLRYLMPHIPQAITGTNMDERKGWLVTHATFSSIALILGPWQFVRTSGGARRAWHRWTGRAYLIAVLIGWISSVPIAAHAQTGLVASMGFLALGVAWIATSALAYVTIRRGDVAAHRRWMIRSYALTSAAITLRVMIPLAAVNGIYFSRSYPVIAWACWLVNLLLVEIWMGTSNGFRERRGVPMSI